MTHCTILSAECSARAELSSLFPEVWLASARAIINQLLMGSMNGAERSGRLLAGGSLWLGDIWGSLAGGSGEVSSSLEAAWRQPAER